MLSNAIFFVDLQDIVCQPKFQFHGRVEMMLMLTVGLLTVLQCRRVAEGHGYLVGPRSRNVLAFEETNWASPTADDPEPETCPHCLNVGGSRARCGIAGEGGHPWEVPRNYDAPRNALGGLMKANAQATYAQGQDVVMDVALTIHHKASSSSAQCTLVH